MTKEIIKKVKEKKKQLKGKVAKKVATGVIGVAAITGVGAAPLPKESLDINEFLLVNEVLKKEYAGEKLYGENVQDLYDFYLQNLERVEQKQLDEVTLQNKKYSTGEYTSLKKQLVSDLKKTQDRRVVDLLTN